MKKDESLHVKRDGRTFQMLSGFSCKPMPFKETKHNYTRAGMETLPVGGAIGFQPMFGNRNPVPSLLIRLK